MPRGLSEYDSARGQGRLWTPAVLRPDAWFDASDFSTITVATGVSEWRDKSGNGLNLSPTSTAPTLKIESQNGLNSIAYASTPTVTAAFSKTYTEQSNIAVFKSALSGANRRLWSNLNGSSSEITYIPMRTSFTGASEVYLQSEFGSTGRAGYRFKPDIWNIFYSSISSTQILTAGNGSSVTSYSLTWSGATVTRFGHPPYDTWGGGELGEVLVYPFAASDAQRQVIEGYMAWKWAIPLAADHPFANRPPLIGD
jgi:hypothetical protein